MTLGKRVYTWLPFQIGAVLVVALAMGAVVLSALERRFLNAAGETLSLAAADIADKLDLVLYERSGDVQALAKSSVRPLAAGDVQALSANLAAVQNAYPIYLWLAVTDKNGRVVASTDAVSRGKDVSGRPWFVAARGGGGLHVGSPRVCEGIQGAMNIAFSMPIIAPDDAFLGVVTAHVGLPALLDLFPRTVRIFKSEHSIIGDVEWELLNQDGSILSESAPQAEAAPNLLDLKVPSARLSLDPAARPGYVEESHTRRRVQVITGYARTNGYGPFTSPLLGVLIRENKSNVLAPIHGFLLKLGTAGAAILLPLLAMLLWTSIRLRSEWLAAVEAERIMRESEDRFRVTFEQAAVGVAHVSPSGRWLRVNQRLCDIVGYSRDELLKLRFQDITHPDDLPLDLDHVRKMLGAEIAAYSMEKRYIRKDGVPVWINLTVSLVRDSSGQPDYFISVIEDIASRKSAEEQLHQLSAELEERVAERTMQLQEAVRSRDAEIAERKRAAATLQDSVVRTQRQGSALTALTKTHALKPDDPDLPLHRITETAAETLGVARASIWQYNQDHTAIHCIDLYDLPGNRHLADGELRAADYPAYFDAMANSDIIDASDAHSDPRTCQFSEGYLRPLGIGAMLDAPIQFQGGTYGILCHEHVGPARTWTQDEKTFALAVANLISLQLEEQARSQAADALRQSEARFRSLIEKSTDMISVLAPDGTIRYESPSVSQLLGYGPDELIGKPIFGFLHPDDLQTARAALAEALATPDMPHTIEVRFRSRAGEWRVLEATGRSTKDNAGTLSVILNSRDTTERKQAESELYQSREMLRLIIDNIPQFVFWKDRNLNYLGCNTLFARVAGLAGPSDISGKSDFDLSWKELADLYRADDRAVMDTNIPKLNFEEPLAGTATPWVIKTSKVPLRDAEGQVIGVLGIFEDITERKLAEEALRVSEERFRTIFDQAPLGIALIDSLTGRIYAVNPRFAQIAGRSIEEMTRIDWMSITHPDDVQKDLDNMALLNTGKISGFQMEKRYLRPSGDAVWINMTIAPVTTADRTQRRHLCMIEDITERKQTEEALRQSQARQALLIRSVPIVLYSAHPGGTYGGTWVSDNIEDITGFTARQFVNDPDLWISRLHPDDREAAIEASRRAVESGFSSTEYRWQCADGQYRWLLDQSVLVTNQAEDKELIGMWLDITERRQAEEALREAEAKFRTLVEQPLLGFYIIGDNGRVAYTNAKLAELFGYSQRELEAVDPVSLTAEPDRERIATNIRRRLAGEPLPPTYTFKAFRKDGKVMDMEVYATRAELHGRPAVIGILRDVTELNRLEAESRRLERLASWGQLLGGIAHELKNPLFILSGHLQLFKERLEEARNPGLAGDFKKIEEAAKRIVVITEHFLHLARPATSKRQHCSIRSLLENTMDALSHELARHHVSSVMLVDDSLPEIWTDPKLLREVFHHLIVNAIEAMAQIHGQRTLTVTAAQIDGAIDVRIQDNGPGIHLDQHTKIFEPFFTTKPADQATGLGLWIVRSNLMVLQGSVRLESEPGKGATFIVRLPLLGEPADLSSARDGEA